MKHEKNNAKMLELLVALVTIPKNLIHIHGLENMTEFLLHNLSQKECFNFSKVAYFVDNADFGMLKGVAGFKDNEAYQPDRSHWHEQDAFSNHMKKSDFNKKVRDYCKYSIKKNGDSPDHIVQELGQVLEFKQPHYMLWPIKYENQGLLLFEAHDVDKELKEHLENSLHLFGFCPVF